MIDRFLQNLKDKPGYGTEQGVVLSGRDIKLFVEQQPKIYRALISQQGTSAPTVIELENSIGNITYAYESEGIYKIICDSLFPLEKTLVFIGPCSSDQATGFAILDATNSRFLTLSTIDLSTSEAGDQLLNKTSIEILVYN